MPIRDYQFVTGAETATLPTATDPVDSTDLVTLSYANSNYAALAPTIQGTGTYASPQAISASATLTLTGSPMISIWFVTGSGGAISLSATTPISAPTRVGQFLYVIGGSDTNTVSFTASGSCNVALNGHCVLALDRVLILMSVATSGTARWIEVGRS